MLRTQMPMTILPCQLCRGKVQVVSGTICSMKTAFWKPRWFCSARAKSWCLSSWKPPGCNTEALEMIFFPSKRVLMCWRWHLRAGIGESCILCPVSRGKDTHGKARHSLLEETEKRRKRPKLKEEQILNITLQSNSLHGPSSFFQKFFCAPGFCLCNLCLHGSHRKKATILFSRQYSVSMDFCQQQSAGELLWAS